ncbi:helix-turn-helix domain-containing protein, partial [Kitasatospora aureofaciens]|uniref:helix-turn-helix domain-containing protein n=1 Tax=Kitasatospora aureofaciens TaxID=1894 RepID=UPI0037C704E1
MELLEIDSTSSPAVRFGEELRRLRRSRRWSQAELGRRMGYSHGLVSYVERANTATAVMGYGLGVCSGCGGPGFGYVVASMTSA